MRIAFVTTEYVSETECDGGLAHYLHRVSLSLRQLGHEPVVFVTSSKNERLFHDGIEVHRVNGTSFFIKVLDRLTFRRFRRVLSWLNQSLNLNRAIERCHRETPISVIQYSSFMATGIFRNKDIPSVVRLSSYSPLWRCGYERETLTMDVRLSEFIERAAFMRGDGIYSPSRLIARIVEEECGKPVRAIEPPFILDQKLFQSEIYERKLEGKKYLLFFGAVGALKGVTLIADIVQPLLERYPELYFGLPEDNCL